MADPEDDLSYFLPQGIADDAAVSSPTTHDRDYGFGRGGVTSSRLRADPGPTRFDAQPFQPFGAPLMRSAPGYSLFQGGSVAPAVSPGVSSSSLPAHAPVFKPSSRMSSFGGYGSSYAQAAPFVPRSDYSEEGEYEGRYGGYGHGSSYTGYDRSEQSYYFSQGGYSGDASGTFSGLSRFDHSNTAHSQLQPSLRSVLEDYRRSSDAESYVDRSRRTESGPQWWQQQTVDDKPSPPSSGGHMSWAAAVSGASGAVQSSSVPVSTLSTHAAEDVRPVGSTLRVGVPPSSALPRDGTPIEPAVTLASAFQPPVFASTSVALEAAAEAVSAPVKGAPVIPVVTLKGQGKDATVAPTKPAEVVQPPTDASKTVVSVVLARDAPITPYKVAVAGAPTVTEAPKSGVQGKAAPAKPAPKSYVKVASAAKPAPAPVPAIPVGKPKVVAPRPTRPVVNEPVANQSRGRNDATVPESSDSSPLASAQSSPQEPNRTVASAVCNDRVPEDTEPGPELTLLNDANMGLAVTVPAQPAPQQPPKSVPASGSKKLNRMRAKSGVSTGNTPVGTPVAQDESPKNAVEKEGPGKPPQAKPAKSEVASASGPASAPVRVHSDRKTGGDGSKAGKRKNSEVLGPVSAGAPAPPSKREPATPIPVVEPESQVEAAPALDWLAVLLAFLVKIPMFSQLPMYAQWMKLWYQHVGVTGMGIVAMQQAVVCVVVGVTFLVAGTMSAAVSLWRTHIDSWAMLRNRPLIAFVYLVALAVSSSTARYMFAPFTLSLIWHVFLLIVMTTGGNFVIRFVSTIAIPLHFIHYGLLNTFSMSTFTVSEVLMLTFCVCWLRLGKLCDSMLLSFAAQALLTVFVVLPPPLALWAYALLSLSSLSVANMTTPSLLPTK